MDGGAEGDGEAGDGGGDAVFLGAFVGDGDGCCGGGGAQGGDVGGHHGRECFEGVAACECAGDEELHDEQQDCHDDGDEQHLGEPGEGGGEVAVFTHGDEHAADENRQ